MASSRYAPRHTTQVRSRTATLAAAVRRPVVGGALAIAMLGSIGAAVAIGDPSHAPAPTAAATSEESPREVVQADLSTADTTRLSEDRRESNVSRSASREKDRRAGIERTKKSAAAQKAKDERRAEAKKKAARSKRASEQAAPVGERWFSAAEIKTIQKDPKPYAVELMRDRGWGDDQWGCLDTLWIGESDWSWEATNSSSGAYGIPQSLPAKKMTSAGADWKTNPITQIEWGLEYIELSYGSPCEALSFWQEKDPHWY